MEPDRSADAIVVLGCRVEGSGALSPTADRRARAAATAYTSGMARRVIASGGRRWGSRVEALVLRDRLIDLGVPRDAILVELLSLTTAENAVYSGEILRGLSGRPRPRAGIATSSWHLRRALSNFEAVGVAAFGIPALAPDSTPRVRAVRSVHETLSLVYDKATLRLAGSKGSAFIRRSHSGGEGAA